jgi:hypothetical protein
MWQHGISTFSYPNLRRTGENRLWGSIKNTGTTPSHPRQYATFPLFSLLWPNSVSATLFQKIRRRAEQLDTAVLFLERGKPWPFSCSDDEKAAHSSHATLHGVTSRKTDKGV